MAPDTDFKKGFEGGEQNQKFRQNAGGLIQSGKSGGRDDGAKNETNLRCEDFRPGVNRFRFKAEEPRKRFRGAAQWAPRFIREAANKKVEAEQKGDPLQ